MGIEIFRRRELPPSRVGRAKPGFDLAEGAELAKAGQALATFAGARFDKLVQVTAANEVATFQGTVNTEIENFSALVKSKPGAPFEELEAERNEMMTRLDDAGKKATTLSAKEDIKNFMLRNKDLIFTKTQNNMLAIRTRQQLEISELHIKNFMATGNIDGLENHYKEMVAADFYTQEFADAKFALEERVMLDAAKDLAIENIKPLLVDSMGENLDKAAGLEALGTALSQLKEDGVITNTEAAQTDKVLGDWMDNYVSGRIKQTKEAEKLTTHQTYTDFSAKLLGGDVSFEDIDNSELLKADKELWQEYVKLSNSEYSIVVDKQGESKIINSAPSKANTKDYINVIGAVFDVAGGRVSAKEGYDTVLSARFKDKGVLDKQYEWAIGKIETPYPEHMLNDIRAIFNSNNENFNTLWRREAQRNINVNDSLFAWLDHQIAEGKSPTRKEMFAISSQFRVGNDRWYDIGQVVQRGGRNWEIIGFDENGEPLVEEIQ